MKKFIIAMLIIIVITMLFSRFMYTKPESDVNYQEINSIIDSQETVNDAGEEISYSFEYTDIHFSHTPNEFIKVSILYPQFKDEKLSTLNSKIEEFAKSTFKEIIADNSDEDIKFTLEETCTVKLANENIISISSNGELNILGNAYPTIIKNSLNINPISFIKYKLSDFINVSDEFIQAFREQSETNEQLVTYLTSFSDDEIKENILNSKMYFDDKDVVIIYEVPHAIGDYIEIKLEYDKFQTFLKS